MAVSGETALRASRGLTSTRRARMRGDAALVRAAQRGSADAFAELFRRHWPRAHRAAWLVVHDAAAAEDVAQEAFLSVLRSLDRFDRRRPFAPWLHRIVVNRAIDWARAHELRRELAAAGAAEPPRAAAPATARAPVRRDARRARAALPRAARRRRASPPPGLHAERDRRAHSTCRRAPSTRACVEGSTSCRTSSTRRPGDDRRPTCASDWSAPSRRAGAPRSTGRGTIVHAAFGERTPRRRRPRRHGALALALLAALTTVALTPPGAAVADWVEDVLSDPAPRRVRRSGRCPAADGCSSRPTDASGSSSPTARGARSPPPTAPPGRRAACTSRRGAARR